MINYFNFKKFNGRVLVVNDIGYSMFLSIDEFIALCSNPNRLDKQIYRELVEKRFILEGNSFIASDYLADELQSMKGFLKQSTSLHIFVVTNNCNMSCVYCQAQSEYNKSFGNMSIETARKAVDIALESPSDTLTFEMQGGEPLINFRTIKEIITYAEQKKGNRYIHYCITTNGTLLTPEVIDFFQKYNVSVSISLDGSKEIHDYNRRMKSQQSNYAIVEKMIPELRKRDISVDALLTTSRYSLGKWKEIVDAYVTLGFHSIFVRPLTPLGFANDHWGDVGYTVNDYLVFYRNILDYILEYNKKGIRIKENHATIFLRKILCQESDNYMELRSPCGAGIGQLAYYYDGSIYTCDEGRMVAQMGDDAFCLGNVEDSSYSDLMNSEICQAVCQASVLEGLPSCSECVYLPYCGVCPVATYAMEGSILSRTNNNYRCRLYKGMLDSIFQHMMNEDDLKIFEKWVEK